MPRRCFTFVAAVLGVSLAATPLAAKDGVYQIGAARVDVTPDYPIRLAGYAARKSESQGIERHIFCRALAISSEKHDLAVIMNLETTGMPAAVTEEVARRLNKKTGLARACFVLCATHTHNAPLLADIFPNMFGVDLPLDQQRRIDRYTADLVDKLERCALDAIADRKPGKLAWGVGQSTLAVNRRPQGGPVDHSMPLMLATDLSGKTRAVLINYACHCTTLGPAQNKVAGDWAGDAMDAIEQDHPGSVAMVIIGCAGDSNPFPRGDYRVAEANGRKIAAEANRLIASGLNPLSAELKARFEQIELPYDKLPTKEAWEKIAQQKDPAARNARLQLAVLARGQPIADTLTYPVQVFTFGTQLSMVFLGGEAVVDYAIRLKHDFDDTRLWVTAYANDVVCYIPSRRILREGGYEAETAMIFYGRPGRLAPDTENLIVRTVHGMLPRELRTEKSLAEFPFSRTPAEEQKSFALAGGLTIQLAAAEPLVESPVAIDFSLDGRMWVVEMRDFPSGMKGNGTPGGRIKVLESTKGNGVYDKATIFLDNLRCPTGVMPWRHGALICAAPDILYAEDTDGDGKADRVRVLFNGFSPKNEQALVNGLAWGLDGWVYGASSIANAPIRIGQTDKTVDLGNRDFRINPDTLAFEPAAGRTQYIRCRDDWDNWFGNDSTDLLWHYPLAENYVRRNPFAAPPGDRVSLNDPVSGIRLFPVSRMLQRYNHPEEAGMATSACGPGICRDPLLGPQFYGNGFACEPVHNLVHRLILESKGGSFAGHRAAENKASEFLASTDNWCRPVQVCTGPDGALYVVDMYRFIVEHPRWISEDRQAFLDDRAGADMGRIWRIYPKNGKPRAIENLAGRSTADLAAKMDHPNGVLRDEIQMQLVWRRDKAAIAPLQQVASHSSVPAARSQALWTLRGLGALPWADVAAALSDSDPRVRRQGVRLSESFLDVEPRAQQALITAASDPDPGVRFAAALAAGETTAPCSGTVLQTLAVRDVEDPWICAAVVSSAVRQADDLLSALIQNRPRTPAAADLLSRIAATVAGSSDDARLARVMASLAVRPDQRVEPWRMRTLAALLNTPRLKHRETMAPESLASIFEAARTLAADNRAAWSDRVTAMALLGRQEKQVAKDLVVLSDLAGPQAPPNLQASAIATIGRIRGAQATHALLQLWTQSSPTRRVTILSTLLSRADGPAELLGALEKQTVTAADIPAAQRNQLLGLSDRKLRGRAEKLLSKVRPSSRQQVLDQFRSALKLPGRPDAGHALFAKTCVTCHRFHEEGHAVGPDLAELTDKSPQAFYTAVLDPNAAVDGRFVAYIIETQGGRTLVGLIANETATSVTMLQGNGVQEVVLRTDIAQMRSSNVSLMPEGLEQGLKPQDIADLIAYLRTAGPRSPKSFEGNEPALVQADPQGMLSLRATNARIFGPTLVLEAQYKNLGMWRSANDEANWTVNVPKPGKYEVWIEFACHTLSAGNTLALHIGDTMITHRVAATASNWDVYQRTRIGQVELRPGKQTASIKAAARLQGALLDLKSVELVPAK